MVDVQKLVFVNGACSNPRLEKLVKEFCDNEFGKDAVHFPEGGSVFVAVKGGVGEIPEVVGIECVTFNLDLWLHHAIGEKANEKRAISAKMIQRLHNSLLDAGFGDRPILIHCAPEVEAEWKDFFERMNAVPANRYIMKVKSNIEI
jgi:hypothetical protein